MIGSTEVIFPSPQALLVLKGRCGDRPYQKPWKNQGSVKKQGRNVFSEINPVLMSTIISLMPQGSLSGVSHLKIFCDYIYYALNSPSKPIHPHTILLKEVSFDSRKPFKTVIYA